MFCRQKPLGAIGGITLVLVVLVAILAGLASPYDPLTDNVPHRLVGPSGEHLLGTDEFGRDVLSRIIYGSRISLYVGLLSVAVATVSGTILGVACAYFGGKVDLIVQRVVDAKAGFPALLTAILLMAALGNSLNNVVIAISVGQIPLITRIARGTALSIKENDYVLAAVASGANNLRVLFSHLIPNCLTPVLVIATGLLGHAIVAEASLSFLGLGVPPPYPSWGRMLQGAARTYTESAPWLVIAPGVALAMTVFGFNLFGDALRDHLDPRLRNN